MATKDYSKMTVDEIDEVKLEKKEKIREIQKEIDEINVFRMQRVEDDLYEEAMKQLGRVAESTGRSVEDVAKDWIDDGDRGHYIQSRHYFTRKGN